MFFIWILILYQLLNFFLGLRLIQFNFFFFDNFLTFLFLFLFTIRFWFRFLHRDTSWQLLYFLLLSFGLKRVWFARFARLVTYRWRVELILYEYWFNFVLFIWIILFAFLRGIRIYFLFRFFLFLFRFLLWSKLFSNERFFKVVNQLRNRWD